MWFFSKEKLSKTVATARKHWWLFVPVLLIICLGYLFFSIADSLHILLLRLYNILVAVYSFIRNCIWGIALFFGKATKKMFSGMKAGKQALNIKMREMNENAQIARTQLLNSAVDYCAERHSRRVTKKEKLRNEARAMLNSKPAVAAQEQLNATTAVTTAPVNKKTA